MQWSQEVAHLLFIKEYLHQGLPASVISGRGTVSQLLLHWDVFESQFPRSLTTE